MRLGLLLSLFLIGCANSTNKCGDTVVLLWPDAKGAYSFQEVLLSTLKSPYELKGSAAEVYYEPSFTDSGFEGEVARPRLTNSDGVCVPTDVGSSMSLTAYAIMERLQQFENILGTSSQLSWPRQMGVEFHITGDEIDVHNNAHYYGQQDVMGVVPYTQSNLPVTLNHGILAHEHFHAHFQSQVIAKINVSMPMIVAAEKLFYPAGVFGLKPTVEDLSADFRSPLGLNNYILRSLNEGLADFFGAIFTGRADFFSDSMPETRGYRSLDLPLAPLADSGQFQDFANHIIPQPGQISRSMTSLAYEQGTFIARLFYKLSQSGVLSPNEFLAHVMQRLDQLPAAVTPEYSTSVLEPDSLVSVLLSGMPLNATACADLRKTVGKNAMTKGFAKCSGL